MPLTTKEFESPERAVSDERQLQALIEVFDCISCHTDLQGLFDDLACRLRRLVAFDALYVSLHDPVRDVMRVSFVETTSPMMIPVGLEIPISESPSGVAWQTQQTVLLDGIADESRFPSCDSGISGKRDSTCMPAPAHYPGAEARCRRIRAQN